MVSKIKKPSDEIMAKVSDHRIYYDRYSKADCIDFEWLSGMAGRGGDKGITIEACNDGSVNFYTVGTGEVYFKDLPDIAHVCGWLLQESIKKR